MTPSTLTPQLLRIRADAMHWAGVPPSLEHLTLNPSAKQPVILLLRYRLTYYLYFIRGCSQPECAAILCERTSTASLYRIKKLKRHPDYIIPCGLPPTNRGADKELLHDAHPRRRCAGAGNQDTRAYNGE